MEKQAIGLTFIISIIGIFIHIHAYRIPNPNNLAISGFQIETLRKKPIEFKTVESSCLCSMSSIWSLMYCLSKPVNLQTWLRASCTAKTSNYKNIQCSCLLGFDLFSLTLAFTLMKSNEVSRFARPALAPRHRIQPTKDQLGPVSRCCAYGGNKITMKGQ